ncbi:MAG: DNA polymerase/3'-5' exonuclease PolX, partial [Planctomycetota bacterium]
TKLDGIGKGVASKCKELVETGGLQQMEDLLQDVPRSVLDLLRIPKLGPKKAKVLFDELNITTLAQLKKACLDHRVRELSGFGAKTEAQILEGMEIAADADKRILWATADKMVNRMREFMNECDAVKKIEFAGSYRRGKETVGDLDMLVAGDPESVMNHFADFEEITSTIVRGSTKMSVRLEGEFQVDLRVVPADSFGAALQYFTGSKEHNVKLRSMAKARGLKINEWGVYRVKGDEEKRVAGKTEKEVYDALDLPVFDPETREDRSEFEWTGKQKPPRLIQVKDMRGDLHMHTTETDGKATLEEMVAGAQDRGLEYIAITDHSKRVAMANGLDEERLLAQWKQIDKLNKKLGDDFVVLKGIECDILENGDMDLPDEVLARADWVVASVHYGQNQPRAQITDRITGAIENPHVCMIAHPTGRLLNKRAPYDVDLDAVFQACVENRKMLELNAAPKRLDLNDVHLAAAKKLGIPVVINTDAHRVRGLDDMQYGIKQARRACLTKNDVANTRTWAKMKKLLGR